MSDDGFGDGTSLPNGSQISNKGAVSDEELEGDDDDQEKPEKDADVFVAEDDKQQKILTKKYEKEHQNYCQRIGLNRNPRKRAARMTKQGSKKGAEESDDDAGSTKDVEEEPEDFNQFEEEEQEDDSNALEDLERSGPIYGDDANWTPEKASRPQLQESPVDKNKSKNKANYVKDNVENAKVPAKTTAAAKKAAVEAKKTTTTTPPQKAQVRKRNADAAEITTSSAPKRAKSATPEKTPTPEKKQKKSPAKKITQGASSQQQSRSTTSTSGSKTKK